MHRSITRGNLPFFRPIRGTLHSICSRTLWVFLYGAVRSEVELLPAGQEHFSRQLFCFSCQMRRNSSNSRAMASGSWLWEAT